MKRFTLTLLLGLFAVSLQACASGQSVPPQTPSSTSGSSIGSTIGNLLEGVFSRSDIDVADMSGIWTVDGSAVAFKSQDFMAKAGGAAVAAKLQTELDPYYQRYGLTGAVLTIDSDGNCSSSLHAAPSTVSSPSKPKASSCSTSPCWARPYLPCPFTCARHPGPWT